MELDCDRNRADLGHVCYARFQRRDHTCPLRLQRVKGASGIIWEFHERSKAFQGRFTGDSRSFKDISGDFRRIFWDGSEVSWAFCGVLDGFIRVFVALQSVQVVSGTFQGGFRGFQGHFKAFQCDLEGFRRVTGKNYRVSRHFHRRSEAFMGVISVFGELREYSMGF